MLKQSGFALIVVSNQGLVARGHGTIADVEATNHRMVELLRARIGSISREIDPDHILDAVYFCPFHPRGTVEHYAREHPWRKPSPGMILHAAEAHGIDVSRSWVVGDSDRDVQAGLAAGLPAAHCLRVGSGAAFADLLAAARHIVVQT